MIRKAIIVALTLGAVVTGVVWLASHQRPVVLHSADTDQWEVGFAVVMGRCVGLCMDQTAASQLTYSRLPTPSFHVSCRRHPIAGSWLAVGFPIWLPLVLFTAYPTLAFIRGPLRRHRRRKRGLCVRCGYDLTGNVSGVCPECGTEVKQR